MLRSAWLAGVGTTLLAVLLLVAQASAGILPHSMFLLFVIPAGALAGGALCGSGLYLRLRLSGEKASWGHHLLAILLGLLGFAGTYGGMYGTQVFDAGAERSRLQGELAANKEKISAIRTDVKLTRERLASGAGAASLLKIEQEEGRARRERNRLQRWLKAAVDEYNLQVRSGKPQDARARGLRADIARYEGELAAAEESLRGWTRRLSSEREGEASRDKDLALMQENNALEAQSKELLENIRAVEAPSPQGFLERCLAGRRMDALSFVRLAPADSKEGLGDPRIGWLQLGLELLGFLAGSLLCALLGDGKEILQCPGCGKSLRVPSQPDVRVRCPSCSQEILLKS